MSTCVTEAIASKEKIPVDTEPMVKLPTESTPIETLPKGIALMTAVPQTQFNHSYGGIANCNNALVSPLAMTK